MSGTWREGSFTGDPERYVKKIYQERSKSALQAGISPIGAPWGNLEVTRLPGLFREKDSIFRFLSWTQRTIRFYVWGPSGTLVKGRGSPEVISDYGTQKARL
jgi:hypothetical protein